MVSVMGQEVKGIQLIGPQFVVFEQEIVLLKEPGDPGQLVIQKSNRTNIFQKLQRLFQVIPLDIKNEFGVII